MKKYYVVVEPGNGSFWYSDKGCTISHREDGPAVEWCNGANDYYLRNVEFSKDQFDTVLAVIDSTPDEPPTTAETLYVLVHNDGSNHWYSDEACTIRHRPDDAPAIVTADGTQEWYVNGKRHRVCGPAVCRTDNNDQFWLRGVKFTEEQHDVFSAMQDDLIDAW